MKLTNPASVAKNIIKGKSKKIIDPSVCWPAAAYLPLSLLAVCCTLKYRLLNEGAGATSFDGAVL